MVNKTCMFKVFLTYKVNRSYINIDGNIRYCMHILLTMPFILWMKM